MKRSLSPLVIGVLIIILSSVMPGGAAAQTANQALPYDLFDREARDNNYLNTYLLAYMEYFTTSTSFAAPNFDIFMERFKKKFRPLGIKYFDFINITAETADTQAVVCSNDTTVWVAFRPSEDAKSDATIGILKAFFDWVLTNFNIGKIRIPGENSAVKVHRGFWNAAAVAYPTLKRMVNEQMKGGKKLWITGFSLGGALAAITGYRLVKSGIPVSGVVSFGAPRTGNSRFCKRLNQSLPLYHRWIYDRDLVTMVPPFLFGFRHAGKANTINDNGRIKLDTSQALLFGKSKSHKLPLYMKPIFEKIPEATRRLLPSPATLDAQPVAVDDDKGLEDRIRQIETGGSTTAGN